MTPKIFFPLALGGALALASALGCEGYESPGPVAGEGLWSHVPADAQRENISPHRQREREVNRLEDRTEELRASLDRIEETLEEAERPRPEQERALETLRARLDPMERRVVQLRGLTDQPAGFRGLRDEMRDTLDELEADIASLEDRARPS